MNAKGSAQIKLDFATDDSVRLRDVPLFEFMVASALQLATRAFVRTLLALAAQYVVVVGSGKPRPELDH